MRSKFFAIAISLTAFSAQAAEPAPTHKYGSMGLSAQAEDAAVSKSAGGIGVTVVVTNDSDVPKQLFLSDQPTATDNFGNSFSENPNMSGAVGGIHICSNINECLRGMKEQTEQNATQLDPGQSLTITLSFDFFNKVPDKLGDMLSVGLLVHARDLTVASDAKWRTISLGSPKIALRGE